MSKVEVCGGAFVDVEKRRRDMERFDGLGPKARAVIRECPKDVETQQMIEAFRQRTRKLVEDPSKMPTLDEQMATFIVEMVRSRFPDFKGPIERRVRRRR